MKKSEIDSTTIVYVVLALIIVALLLLLYMGLKDAGFGIFEDMDSVIK